MSASTVCIFYKGTSFLFLLLIASCQGKDTSVVANIANQQDSIVELESITEGYRYSPSEIDELVAERIRKTNSSPIDTIRELQGIECGELFKAFDYQIDSDTIHKYEPKVYQLSDELKKILAVSSCFKKLKETENYEAFIFLTEVESHYSVTAKLISISKEDQEINQMDIAYNYGNELEEKSVRTSFKGEDTFLMTIAQHYHYIHGIGAVDSIDVKNETYRIDKKGKFIRIN